MYSTKDLARVAMLKEYRERGQSVVCIARKDIKRSETLVVPFTPSTTIGDVKAMMPGDTDILGHPRLWFLPVREKRPFEYMTLGAQQYGSPMRLYELHADGSAQTLIEAGVPNEALLELTRAEAAIDREPSAEQLAARAARKAREPQEAEARRAEAVAAQAAERLKRQAALEATQAAAAAAKRAEKEAATSLWAQEIAREEQKMAREAEKQAKREAKRQAREQKRPHKEATPNNELRTARRMQGGRQQSEPESTGRFRFVQSCRLETQWRGREKRAHAWRRVERERWWTRNAQCCAVVGRARDAGRTPHGTLVFTRRRALSVRCRLVSLGPTAPLAGRYVCRAGACTPRPAGANARCGEHQHAN
jgi:flagellar biosynthesis GTPase FlhF